MVCAAAEIGAFGWPCSLPWYWGWRRSVPSRPSRRPEVCSSRAIDPAPVAH